MPKRERKAVAATAGGGGGAWEKTYGARKDATENGVRRTPPAQTWRMTAGTQKALADKRYGEHGMAFDGGAMPYGVDAPVNGTSIFDPVLCELAYRWFCPPGGTVLDPFAGGSVRGIVAYQLGRAYVGIDLSERQIAANRIQAANICAAPGPIWRVGDSRDIATIAADVDADFLFSCPPYADLERYSNDPADLSTLEYAEFREAYTAIIAGACARLKDNRFACFVVGDVRDRKRGYYHGFPWHTVDAFQRAGLGLYNEAVLVTAAGSLPVRARYPFESARKMGKTHQNVLVFCKGDPRKATEAVGPCDFGEGEAGGEQSPADAAASSPDGAIDLRQFGEPL